MPTIIATDRDGTRREVQGKEGYSLMEILRSAGLSIEALCGGSCQCATCHVYIDEPWLSRLKAQSEFELAAIEEDGSELQDNSRLSCQINWQPELDGITLIVAPEA